MKKEWHLYMRERWSTFRMMKNKRLILLLSTCMFFASGWGNFVLGSELREVEYMWERPLVSWAVASTHVVCDSCPPIAPLHYSMSIEAAAPYIVRVAAPETKDKYEDVEDKEKAPQENAKEKESAAGLPAATDANLSGGDEPDKGADKDKNCNSVSKGEAADKTEQIATVLFDFDSYKLTMTESRKLLGLIENIKQAKEVSIHGYTCDIGEKGYNDRLALERAKAVAFFLIENGADSEAIEIKSAGKCCYADNKNKSLNRRVEVTVSSTQKQIK